MVKDASKSADNEIRKEKLEKLEEEEDDDKIKDIVAKKKKKTASKAKSGSKLAEKKDTIKDQDGEEN